MSMLAIALLRSFVLSPRRLPCSHWKSRDHCFVQEADRMQHPRRLYQAPSNEVDASGAVAPEPGILGPDDALFSDAPTAVDPPDPDETGAAANVTIVLSAQDLQRATATGAVDIEIRAHLDLRGLWRRLNPAIPGHETWQNPKRNALLYAQSPLRSIRVWYGRVTGPLVIRLRSLGQRLVSRLRGNRGQYASN